MGTWTPPHPHGTRLRRGLASGAICAAALLAATSTLAGGEPARGYRLASTALARDLERRLLDFPDPAHARALARELAAAPRVAGTVGMARTTEWLRSRLESWGLEVTTHEYDVYMPHASRVTVERLTPRRQQLPLREEVLAEDPATADAQYPAVAGYSAAGDVSARVVYANYATREDFEVLASRGIDVRGAVVVARFGRTFRGMKVRNATEAGAAAVLLYSDPADDGYSVGRVYPDGPFRPGSGIQRGSVKIGFLGDPSTPGWPSYPGAPRLSDPAAAGGVATIPVVAMGYQAAAEILGELHGGAAPAGWQGGLPFAYGMEDPEVTARVLVELDQQPYKRIANTVATIRGATHPDEWVLVGAHADAWTHGAMDNVSGTVSLLEAARALSSLALQGVRPQRSIVLALWDAEEWGLVGSAEWVEAMGSELQDKAVAYINQDGVAGGPYFTATASPSLAGVLREVAAVVPDPIAPGWSVLDGWRTRSGVPRGAPVEVVPPGAGSDDASFFGHLGIATAGFGFSAPSGVYHSAYDTFAFMERFGDPGFRQHVAAASVTALLAWRLASADLLPFDYRDYADVLVRQARLLQQQLERRDARYRVVPAADLSASTTALAAAAGRFERAAREVLTRGSARGSERGLVAANRILRQVEPGLTRLRGLSDRPWYRNLAFAPDRDDSYSVQVFPGVVEALRDGELLRARVEIRELEARLVQAAAQLDAAAAALVGRSAVFVAGS